MLLKVKVIFWPLFKVTEIEAMFRMQLPSVGGQVFTVGHLMSTYLKTLQKSFLEPNGQ